jgi:hypothetical protein
LLPQVFSLQHADERLRRVFDASLEAELLDAGFEGGGFEAEERGGGAPADATPLGPSQPLWN